MIKKLEKAIRHFECMRDNNIAVLNSGFGTKKGEHNSLYKNRKMYAELAIKALEKQVPKKPTHEATIQECHTCPSCKNVLDRFDKTLYCFFCGQRLDWSDEDGEGKRLFTGFY